MKGEKSTNIVFGRGVFKVDGEAIGLTRDGGTFNVEYDNRVIEADGDRGTVKGRVHREGATATIEINHLELLTSFEKLHPAVKVDTKTEQGYTKITGTGVIDDKTDYHDVSFEGETKDGREFIVSIKNAINLDNLSLEFKDKDEIVDKVTFSSTYDPEAENQLEENWEIKYKTAGVPLLAKKGD
jgi:hypothetical protein|nr:MAG TPA: major tail protein [Caudoviricetes sp.]